ncbi:MAG: UDP-N-acetylglucosamine pyrophosphorylase [Lachnoclostridium sp.]|nr:UDP-N-acetylglucosamine pyrophosphorylase [Lachnospira sp.]MCM1248341.1 UDP-N-acetylglucosamine pyrophosphorylase [Lachnoclostridium sp.]
MENIKVKNLFNLNETIAAGLFEEDSYPWEALPRIHDFILELGKSLPEDVYEKRGEDIWVAKSAKVAPTACLNGPLIIDEEAEIRHCAFIRGNAIVGKGAVVGNSTELKNVVLFNRVQVPHYNYVGDSILGFGAHMGAGSITSNVKSDKSLVVIKGENIRIETGLKKMGAILGDRVEVGCNSVLNPGTVIGRESTIYPTSCVRGVIPGGHIFKDKDNIVAEMEFWPCPEGRYQ